MLPQVHIYQELMQSASSLEERITYVKQLIICLNCASNKDMIEEDQVILMIIDFSKWLKVCELPQRVLGKQALQDLIKSAEKFIQKLKLDNLR